MNLNPTNVEVQDIRDGLDKLKPADAAFARHDFDAAVRWIERAVLGRKFDAPHALHHVGQDWFQRTHPSPGTLLRRLIARARAWDGDAERHERVLLQLALDFPNTFNR